MSKKSAEAKYGPVMIDVYVKLPSGRTSSQKLSGSDLVEKIYQNVADEEGVPVGRVRIKYTGKVLQKHHTISYLGICRETILKGEVIFPKDVPVYIKTEDGRCFGITLSNIDTILKLKGEITRAENHPIVEQRLQFGSRVLSDNSQTLMDYGITDEAVINLTVVKIELSASNIPTVEAEAPEATKEAMLSSFSLEGRNVEVVFSFDTTGSMFSCLSEVRGKVREACRRLLRDIPNIRIGIIAHGDYCDQSTYVLRSVDLTTNVDALTQFANDVPSTGGGDSPECYEWVLKKAQECDWSENSAKALVMIGDCEPHPPSYTDQSISWHEELDVLAGMGIKVYGVQAQRNSTVEAFYRELSERTGGCYINFRHFSLITDMFLAVCYKESSAEQLEAFSEEIKQEGRMTEETQAMFTQLEVHTHPEAKEQRYVKVAWWDFVLDKTETPSFKYVASHNRWEPFHEEPTPVYRDPSITGKSRKSRTKKRGCEIM